jgi:hypothetical protein
LEKKGKWGILNEFYLVKTGVFKKELARTFAIKNDLVIKSTYFWLKEFFLL